MVSNEIDDIWAADTAQMNTADKKENDGYIYFLVVIDIFSKYAWARPLKTKTAKEVTDALSDILKTSNRRCNTLFTDR
jgi:hypothetical protein